MAYSQFFRKHQHILVVDDEAAISDSLSYALTVEGYDVVTAANGSAALQAIRSKRPDLVICDYMMPEMTGAQLAMEMRASRKCAGIPVILCTGAHIAQAESQAGLFDVILTKPYPVSTLLCHIDQLMRQTAGEPEISDRHKTAVPAATKCARTSVTPTDSSVVSDDEAGYADAPPAA